MEGALPHFGLLKSLAQKGGHPGRQLLQLHPKQSLLLKAHHKVVVPARVVANKEARQLAGEGDNVVVAAEMFQAVAGAHLVEALDLGTELAQGAVFEGVRVEQVLGREQVKTCKNDDNLIKSI